MYKRLLSSAIVFGMAAIAPPAQAQSVCAPRETVTQRLDSTFSEVQLATGLLENGVLVEIWASPTTGTWTIFLTRPDGTSCITSAGTALSLGLKPLPPAGVSG